MRARTINRLRWSVLVLGLMVFCLVFASNRFFYLPFENFPALARLQWTHQPSSDLGNIRPVVVGHRGSGLRSTNPDAAPANRLIGNTRRSIQAAIDAKVDWIEIDIQASEDGELIVFHDSEIDAKTTHSGIVKDMTLQALKSCEVMVDPPEKILSLKEVFGELHTDSQRWVLDVKAVGISDDLITEIETLGIPNDQIMIFGSHDVLEAYKGKGYRLGYITFFSNHRSMLVSPSAVFNRCVDNSYDLLVVPLVFVTPRFVAGARKNNVDVWSYGSNDLRDLKYSIECGVNGLIVDMPEVVMSEIGGQGWLSEPSG